MKKLVLGLALICFTFDLHADTPAVCTDPTQALSFIQNLCLQFQSCQTYMPKPVVAAVKKKRKKKPVVVAVVPTPTPAPSPTPEPVVALVPEVVKEPQPNFWLEPFVGVGFSQFDLDATIGSTRIISREDQTIGAKMKFTYEDVNPYVRFSVRNLELEAPTAQSFDHGSDNLYDIAFGVQKDWSRFSLMGQAGYRHEIYFRNYNSPVITVDKFFVPNAQIGAKYKVINNKSFDLSVLGNVSYSLPFNARLSGSSTYRVEDTTSIDYGLEFSKKFKHFSLGSSLILNERDKSSDQGDQKDSSVNFGINLVIPFTENF